MWEPSFDLSSPIDDMELTIRSANCLRYSGIKTVGQLCVMTKRQTMSIKNIGRKSLEEIEGVLAMRGYKFGMAEEIVYPKPKEESIGPDPKPLPRYGGDQYILVCERDTQNPFNNSGPIAMEQMMGKSALFDVIERADSLNGRYGRTGIFKLVYVGTPEECKNLPEAR